MSDLEAALADVAEKCARLSSTDTLRKRRKREEIRLELIEQILTMDPPAVSLGEWFERLGALRRWVERDLQASRAELSRRRTENRREARARRKREQT